jgi:hypothetical protein
VDADATRSCAESACFARAECDSRDARAVLAHALDGHCYLLVANFAENDAAVTVTLPGNATGAADLADGATVAVGRGLLTANLSAGEARVLRLNS